MPTPSVPKYPLGLFPPSVRPYLELIRLEKPTGTKLMFWPFSWGLTMGAYRIHLPLEQYWIEILKCLFGAFILRCTACTINDILDREVDAGVERTKNRPLASGRISLFRASIYVFIQSVVGICFFYATTSGAALYVALFQLIPLFAVYPLFKRFTYWPQAWLGIAMNFGFITAWISTTGSMDAHLIFAGMTACWCWTMLYDTIYACQDKSGDIKMGIRSTAILFGSWIRPFLVASAAAFLSMLAIAGYLNEQGAIYYALSVGGTAVHLVWQLFTVDPDDQSSCWAIFNSNGQLGQIVWTGLMLDYLGKLGLVPC
ncbi:UbiA prenyltransferase family-domain-containing protein [Amanita rubescens]|nr:UbiA prenyltransferase family-domain-containing protein [Amanita rubescens]